MFQPLKDVRVIDLSQVLAGPFATYQMALMGAEVIKIEKPGEGDWTRRGTSASELSARGLSLAFCTQNAGKKSVTLDLKSPEGLEIARDLVAGADVFVENFKPGVAERLGLGFEAVREINPKIVYVSISAYGQDGPMGPRPAYDHVVQGMCGIMKTTGRPGDGPTKVGAPYVDYATGMNAALATLAALLEARRTGRAVRTDVAMLDTALMLMASLMTQHLSTGWVPSANGNEAWSQSPSSGAFETADGMLMLAANNAPQFHRLCAALGRDDLREALPRILGAATPEARGEAAAALRSELNAALLERPAAEWEAVLSDAGVPAARVRGLEETMAEEQVRVRGLMHRFAMEGAEQGVHVPTLGFKIDGEACPPQAPPHELGFDTDAVLQTLGLPPDRIRALRAAGVV